LTIILNGIVFVVIGLQLPLVLAEVSELNIRQLILYAALFSIFLILLRVFWMFSGRYIAYFISSRVFHQNEKRPDVRQTFIIGWTGMRGAIAVAAAISLPLTIADGSPFPHRDLILSLTFSVVLITLVFQGLTLSPLIRLLGQADTSGSEFEAQEERRLVPRVTQPRFEQVHGSDPSRFAESYKSKHERQSLRHPRGSLSGL
jgi:monovalent cation/hydrogen antiporter